MSYISKIIIQGYKKFENIEIEFNKNKNILVGENEAGKSTILEAINIVLNQKHKTQDKYIIKEMLNTNNMAKFKENPKICNLPKIKIGIDLKLDSSCNNIEYFGENNIGCECAKQGIVFECVFDEEEYGDMLKKEIENGEIPLEYYKLSWNTYQGSTYKIMKKPLKTILINTATTNSENSFNYYNKTLFKNKYENDVIMHAKNSFRDKLNSSFDQISLEKIDENRSFGINHKKVILDGIISVYEGEIPLEQKGSGMENLIKTEIALNKQNNNIDVVLIEEPENHLSHGNLLKMIKEIEKQVEEGQLIITTHNDLIASRLDLRNIIWISGDKSKRLEDISDDTANFFSKADNNNLLQFLLSKKVMLVEGATEYLALPKIYFKIRKKSIEDDKVSIISCRNLSYKRYLEIAKNVEKRIAVITDNDGKEENIKFANKHNKEKEKSHIFMDNNINNWTWETCFYNLNTDFFEEKINVDDKSEYLFHKKNYGKVLGKMLNNKVEIAYKMLDWIDEISIPTYIEEMIKWINE